jgi:transcriptional regulator with XRE-family HTH domain
VLKNVIQKLRKKRSVSKAQFAREIGRSRSYVTRLERGDIYPSAESLFQIAAYFKRPVEDVFQLVVDVNAVFFTSKTLPVRQHNNLTPVGAKPLCVKQAAPSARPAGLESTKDKSLAYPTSKK